MRRPGTSDGCELLGFNASDAASENYRCDLSGLVKDPSDRGTLHELIRVPCGVMRHFMREYAEAGFRMILRDS